MTISAFDHPLLGALLGDEEVAASFSLDADLAAMLAFEAALAEAQASLGLLPTEAARDIA
ncbi:MAG: 3-carboxy-cis,cis-muconate cycloisomerase, partial [Roseiarcus sp.]